MNPEMLQLLRASDAGLSYSKDREETISNYKGHSTTNSSTMRKTLKHRNLYSSNEEWQDYSVRPPLTRVIYRSNRGSDPLSTDLFKKPSNVFLTTRYPLPNHQPFKMQQDLPTILTPTEQLTNSSSFQGFGNRVSLKDQINFNRSQFQRTNSKFKFSSNKSAAFLNQQGRNIVQFPTQQQSPSYRSSSRANSGNQRYASQEVSPGQKSPEKETQKTEGESEMDGCSAPTDEGTESTLFDQISNQDWYKLLPEEVLNNKNIDLDKFFIDNSEYFYNLLCMNAQLKGSKPMLFNNDSNSNVKLKYSPAFSTTYNKDFFRKNNKSTSIPKVTDKMMQTNFLGLASLDFTSQMKNDYKDNGTPEVERVKPGYKHSEKPFMGLTSYNSNFIDWKEYSKQSSQAPKHHNIVEAPFMGKTSYQESFGSNLNKKGEIAFIDKKRLFNSPFPAYPVFFGETNYSSEFKNFTPSTPDSKNNESAAAMAATERLFNKTQSQSYVDQIPAYEGQFRTTMQKDFSSMKDEQLLTNKLKKIWRKKILNKLEELRDGKDQKKPSNR